MLSKTLGTIPTGDLFILVEEENKEKFFDYDTKHQVYLKLKDEIIIRDSEIGNCFNMSTKTIEHIDYCCPVVQLSA